MSAPTPISALLHSSTMVIVGVYLGIINVECLVICLFVSLFVITVYFCLVCSSLLFSVLVAINISDVKSIIAFSTVCNLSFMFLSLVINSVLCLLHIIIHALFKSLLFIVSGNLIHIQFNQQSIYRIKILSSVISVSYILLSFISVFCFTKEVIINSLNFGISFSYLFALSLVGSLFTILYSVKIWYYCFVYSIVYSIFDDTFNISFVYFL